MDSTSRFATNLLKQPFKLIYFKYPAKNESHLYMSSTFVCSCFEFDYICRTLTGRFTYFRHFLFSLLLIQILNISFDCVNIFQSVKSGRWHKIVSDSQSFKLLADSNDNTSSDDSPSEENNTISEENSEIVLCVPQVESVLSIEPTFQWNPNKRISLYENFVSELNPPPPKHTS